jgi:hypothetical protein
MLCYLRKYFFLVSDNDETGKDVTILSSFLS